MNDDYVDVPQMMELCGIVRRKTMQDSYIAPALTDQITKTRQSFLSIWEKLKDFSLPYDTEKS